MKTMTVTLAALCLLLGVSLQAAAPASDQRVSQERKVSDFHRIELSTVAEVIFTQSDRCSFHIEGEAELVNDHISQVDAGTLVVKMRKEKKKVKEGVKIFLTAPRLDFIEFSGVGTLHIDQPLQSDQFRLEVEGVGKVYIRDLKCKQCTVDVEGVGKADIHVECERLRARLEGIGSITLSGRADYATIEREGIGSVDTSRLKVLQKNKD